MSTITSVEFRVRNIPDNDYWRLKAIAALDKVTVNEKLLRLIHEEVERRDLQARGN